jgi:hypothetical protein
MDSNIYKYIKFYFSSVLNVFRLLKEVVISYYSPVEVYILDIEKMNMFMYSFLFYKRQPQSSTPDIKTTDHECNLHSLIFQFNESYPDISNIWSGWIGVSGSRNLYISYSNLKYLPEYCWFLDFATDYSMVNKDSFSQNRKFVPVYTPGFITYFLRKYMIKIPSYRLLNQVSQ